MNIIIVGGGLAGLCLAHEFEKQNIPFKIIDKGVNYSTNVAGGMINPITFRRMIKTWRCEQLIDFIADYYPRIEGKIGERFFYPQQIRRYFSSEEEKKLWQEKETEEGFKKHLQLVDNSHKPPIYINDKFGSGIVNTPGYINAKTFLKSNQKYFQKQGKLEFSVFQLELLDIENKTYKSEKFTHLIFAEGFEGENNPFFNYLPFKNAKGEILTIKSRILENKEIINRKCFLLPANDGEFLLGSTYTWGTNDVSTTEEAKNQLVKDYLELSTAAIEITNHEAGIRPVATDRRPLLGEHPDFKGVYIFNGLGAKGFLIAPYFAEHFVGFLKGESKLFREVDIARFYRRFYGKE